MFEVVAIFIIIFLVMTAFVLFIDKLSDFVDAQFHSAHHNRIEYDDDTEKIVD